MRVVGAKGIVKGDLGVWGGVCDNGMHVLPSVHSAHRQEIYIDAAMKFSTHHSYP
jgi:hypothetical protein